MWISLDAPHEEPNRSSPIDANLYLQIKRMHALERNDFDWTAGHRKGNARRCSFDNPEVRFLWAIEQTLLEIYKLIFVSSFLKQNIEINKLNQNAAQRHSECAFGTPFGAKNLKRGPLNVARTGGQATVTAACEMRSDEGLLFGLIYFAFWTMVGHRSVDGNADVFDGFLHATSSHSVCRLRSREHLPCYDLPITL